MKDYYSILEINESSSKETIEKVHKLLIKRYHPDLQPENKKAEAEEKMKEINEAYEVLTNPTKKEKYDVELKEYKIQQIMKEIREQSSKQSNNYQSTNKKETRQKQTEIRPEVQKTNTETMKGPFNVSDEEIRRQAQVYYDELYKQYLYRNGYVKTTAISRFKDKLAKVLTLLVMIGLGYILFNIPYINNMIKEYVQADVVLNAFFGNFFK